MENRRKFLTVAAAGAAGVLAAGGVSYAETPGEVLPIVDCHQHLWDLAKFRLPWIEKGSLLDRSYVTNDYLQAAEGLNVAQAVYMEVDVARDQKQAEVEYVEALCASGKSPTRAAVVGGDLTSDAFASYAQPLAKSKYVKGVRQVLHGAKAGTCLSEPFIASVRLLGKLGLSFDLCMRPTELADGIKLVDLCQDTRFILDHCGNADVKAWMSGERRGDAAPSHDVEAWKKDVAALAGKDNVICKISGIVAAVPKEWSPGDLAPIVNHCLDNFGPDRVIFGSDWPVCLMGARYGQWVSALKEIIASRPVVEQRKLLSENAIKFYGLQP